MLKLLLLCFSKASIFRILGISKVAVSEGKGNFKKRIHAFDSMDETLLLIVSMLFITIE